jgi:hypothetical protein
MKSRKTDTGQQQQSLAGVPDEVGSPPLPLALPEISKPNGQTGNGSAATTVPDAIPEPVPTSNGEDRSASPITPGEEEALSQEERDFREVSVDVDDPSRAPAIILRVTKTPDKELFYRTKIGFELKLHLLLSQQSGQIDVSYLAVTQAMVEPLRERRWRRTCTRFI